MFQNYALFPHLNVQDNVAFGLRRQRVERGEVQRRVGEALELVQLTGLEKRSRRSSRAASSSASRWPAPSC